MAAHSDTLLKISELAEQAEVPVATVRHYLREGLLPEPVKTSRNMAYYPPEFVERIRLIKQLQEERFMPLKLIKSVLEEDPDRARARSGSDPIMPLMTRRGMKRSSCRRLMSCMRST